MTKSVYTLNKNAGIQIDRKAVRQSEKFVQQFEAAKQLAELKPTCPACNIDLEPAMSYYCPRTDCPCGLGSVTG